MKNTKLLSATLAVILVCASSFIRTTEQFGFIQKVQAEGEPVGVYDFVLVDLDMITSYSCTTSQPSDFCLATVDLSDPDVHETRLAEFVLFRASETASGITYQSAGKIFDWVP